MKILKFGAQWCGPCKTLDPIFNKVKAQFTDIDFEMIDIDEDYQMAEKYKIASVPTIVIEIDGRVMDKFVGLQTYDSIMTRIKEWKK